MFATSSELADVFVTASLHGQIVNLICVSVYATSISFSPGRATGPSLKSKAATGDRDKSNGRTATGDRDKSNGRRP